MNFNNKGKMTLDQAQDLRLPYGKFKGLTIKEVNSSNPNYLAFLLDETNLVPWLEQAITLVVSGGACDSVK